MKKKMIGFFAAILILFMAGGVNATYIESGTSNEGLGSFTGDLSYDPSTGKLTVELTNTSEPNNEGYLTGFVLNAPDGIDSVSLEDDGNPFVKVESENAAPYGTFDFGAALGGKFLGGGRPNAGIGVGESKTFVFNFTGTGLDSLTDQSFINAFNTGRSQGEQFMITRFRGFADGGSDKAPGTPGTPGGQVPEPATIALLFGGLGVLGFRRIRDKIGIGRK